ncbi:MAG: hypothetical protein HFJ48_06060 [Clostridia bacterium]|nr:hypothetical protein [Clostridia bacterium]
MSKTGIVNVRMVITEEKILSNIDKIQKMINPNNKKQIVQLYEDTYFKDLIESIKAYLMEYPKKKNFPTSVYKAAYGLVETATSQFEENTKKVSELIRQREENIQSAGRLRDAFKLAQEKDKDWKDEVKGISQEFSEDVIEALNVVGRARKKDVQNCQDAEKLILARINNLEANLHIEIDMERIEDKSKALSYIGIEVADALKVIPSPTEETNVVNAEEVEIEEIGVATEAKANVETTKQPVAVVATVTEDEATIAEEMQAYQAETTVEAKPTLWQKIKGSKFVKALTFISRIRIRIEAPSNALPEGRGEN